MRAVVVDPSVPARRRPNGAPVVSIAELPDPQPHAPGWVTVRPALSGICAADLELFSADAGDSPLSALLDGSPFVPGHEIVGVVEQAHKTRLVHEGMRVIVEPTLRCSHKGLPECERCRSGEGHLCENRDRSGPLCSGQMVGRSSTTRGGWGELVLVHEDMLIDADGLTDQRAVLAEPLAAAIHAVEAWTGQGERALVIGGGTLSRLIVATLRRRYPSLDITVVCEQRRAGSRSRVAHARREVRTQHVVDRSAEMAAITRVGADRMWRAAPVRILELAAHEVGARMLRPRGEAMLPVLDRGMDLVVDCRATEASVELGVRLVRAGGTIVMAGRPGRQSMDWSLVWSRQVSIRALRSFGRGPDTDRTIVRAKSWLSDPAFPVDELVTHRFPLDQVETALATARGGAGAGAIKVVLQGSAVPLTTRMVPETGAVDPDAPVILAGIASRRNAAPR